MSSIKHKSFDEVLNARRAVRQTVRSLLNNPVSTINVLLTGNLECCRTKDLTTRFVFFHLLDVLKQLEKEIDECSDDVPKRKSIFSFLRIRPDETEAEIVSRFDCYYRNDECTATAQDVAGSMERSLGNVPPEVPPFKLCDLRSSSSSDSLFEVEVEKSDISCDESSHSFSCTLPKSVAEKCMNLENNQQNIFDSKEVADKTFVKDFAMKKEKKSNIESCSENVHRLTIKMPTTSLRKTALEPQNGICRSHTEIFHHQCCNNTDQIRIPAQISARWVNKEKANGCSREEIERLSVLAKSKLDLSEEGSSSSTFAHISPLPRYF
uniref:CARD domain-containing protein n=1 Tax=Syphacia muris TaxID=451379 RepID=A0A0N5API9_9BILA